MVNDIDYFTFPQRFLQREIEKQNYYKSQQFFRRYQFTKRRAIIAILRYTKLLKKGLCKFPAAITLLDQVRRDKEELKVEVNNVKLETFKNRQFVYDFKAIFNR